MALTAEDFGFTQTFLNQHNDVARVVQQAIDEEWTTTRAIAAIKGTQWWVSKSDAQRRADALAAENPAELQRQMSQAQGIILRLANSLGFIPTTAQVQAWTDSMVRNGLTEDEVRDTLAQQWSMKGDLAVGQGGQVVATLQKAAGDYGVKVGNDWLQNAARIVLRGAGTTEGFFDYFREQAKVQYGQAIAGQIDKGFTVRQIIEPYLQTAAQELGVNPNAVDISEAKWAKAIQGVDGTRPMTQDEWVKTIRTDTQYGWDKTQAAQRQASILAGGFMEAFGAKG